MNRRHILIGLAVGIVVTIPTLFLAIVSGGGGHGTYVFARLFFPYTMLLTVFQDDTLTVPLILLALVQFPLYGGATAWAASQKPRRRVAVFSSIVLLHSVFATLCFSGFLPNFS